jgi:hypothetical protein
MRPNNQPSVLFVCEREDNSAREAREAWEAAGAIVQMEPDVYACMARLSQGEQYDRVVVDVRCLDRHEIAFLTLTPRYFPELVIQTPWLNGTTEAVVGLGQPDLITTEVAAIAESLAEIRQKAASLEKVEPLPDTISEPASTDPRTAPLSTDGAQSESFMGPSLHEAVRMRMAAEDGSAPVRRPPARTPPGQPPPASQNVSPEELEALFDTGDFEDGNGGSAP